MLVVFLILLVLLSGEIAWIPVYNHILHILANDTDYVTKYEKKTNIGRMVIYISITAVLMIASFVSLVTQ